MFCFSSQTGKFFHNCHCKGLRSCSSILHKQFSNQILLHCLETGVNLELQNSTVTCTSLWHTGYKASNSLFFFFLKVNSTWKILQIKCETIEVLVKALVPWAGSTQGNCRLHLAETTEIIFSMSHLDTGIPHLEKGLAETMNSEPTPHSSPPALCHSMHTVQQQAAELSQPPWLRGCRGTWGHRSSFPAGGGCFQWAAGH